MKLIKLSATWCQPCKQLSKVIEATSLPCEVQNVDIDESPDLAIQYGVRSVPTLVLVDDSGTVLRKTTGAMNQKQLIEFVGA